MVVSVVVQESKQMGVLLGWQRRVHPQATQTVAVSGTHEQVRTSPGSRNPRKVASETHTGTMHWVR